MLLLSLTLMTLFICLTAAVMDISKMKISNILVIAVLCLYTQYAIANYLQGTGNIKGDISTAAILFVITTVLFFTNIIGGGDAKLMSALGLWVGLTGLFPFLFAMSVAGLIIGIIALLLRRALQNNSFYDAIPKLLKHPDSWIGQLRQNKSKLPYGVAIACGMAFSVYDKGLLY
jgi:prepilin peptidase CpaA